jgi:hypothetical protein
MFGIHCCSFKVEVKVTLQLAVFCQSVHPGNKPLEIHDQSFLFKLIPCGHGRYVTTSLMGRCDCLLRICLTFHQEYYLTYSMLLKILPFALYASLLSIQALQSRSCLSYVSHITMAA